jgi:hypothetical protein
MKLFIYLTISLIIGFIIGNNSKTYTYVDNSSMIEQNITIEEIYDTLDLTTFRNSTNVFRKDTQKYFKDLDLNITSKTKDSFTIENDAWYYKMTILRQEDINKDGITDVAVCFQENAKEGTYNTQTAMLLTQYYIGWDFIALDFEVFDCEEWVR